MQRYIAMKLPPWLVLLLPAIITLLAVVPVPLLLPFYSSFTADQLTRPDPLFKWIGIFNYGNWLPTRISGGPSGAPPCC